MKAAQIKKYSKTIQAEVVEIPKPTIQANEILVKVKVAAVNPLEILNITGAVKLIQDYKMPITIGNELTGTVEEVGTSVTGFEVGDAIYTRLPVLKIGAFAEYVAVRADAVGLLPVNLTFETGAAAALTGLTAIQGLREELAAKSGQTLFIPGGSGSFGQMAIPVAKAMGLKVIVSGNAKAKERTLAMGADRYLDYRAENYWEELHDIDLVIDTLGPNEFDHELQIMKKGGRLLSLKTSPNKQFAVDYGLPKWKQFLFGLVGAKYDKKAAQAGVEYRFIFVRADGQQLQELTKIIETNNIIPAIDATEFTIEDINEALQLVATGHPNGKVLIKFK